MKNYNLTRQALGYRHANKCIKPQYTDCKSYIKGYELAISEMEKKVASKEKARGYV